MTITTQKYQEKLNFGCSNMYLAAILENGFHGSS